MRICLYTETALPRVGGQELVVDCLAREFTSAGHEVLVLAPRNPMVSRTPPPALPYETAWHPRFVSTRRLVSPYGWWLAAAHRRHRFDVVHCHSTYPNGYVAACCRALDGVPVVITSHGQDVGPGSIVDRKPELADRYRMALRRCDAAVAIGRFTARRYRALCPEVRRIHWIPNGVALDEYRRAAPRPPRLPEAIRPRGYFLFLGRMVHRKGIDLLLEAVARLGDACPLRVVVAGDGPCEAEIRQLAETGGLGPRTDFVGPVAGEEKLWLLQNSLCAVMPSRYSEAFPLVALESYAAGRPVIGTRVPCLDDVVKPDRTGLLVRPECVASLAEALHRATTQPALLEELAREARAWVEGYRWSRVAAEHIGLYEQLRAGCRAAA